MPNVEKEPTGSASLKFLPTGSGVPQTQRSLGLTVRRTVEK
jgi:hypothetical protein